MAAYRDLWKELCSFSNLELAYQKARKHKTQRPYVLEFEQNLVENLSSLKTELLLHCYRPKPLQAFILRDPKTRKISKSDFRDRVVHHALCNIIEPMFEKVFISDSYANRRGKGTLKALNRFDNFKRKVSRNFTTPAFVLKADVRHYFDEVDHSLLLAILKKKIKDPKVLWLIKRILSNYSTQQGKGMPLGNLTSQFFANVYLNELDSFVKQKLRARYYLRYVDDFVIFDASQEELQKYKTQIEAFLRECLSLQLHPDKSKIIPLQKGVDFLGLKVFSNHKLIKKRNFRKFQGKLSVLSLAYHENAVGYDDIYEFLEGWIAYAKSANTYKLRRRILLEIEQMFPNEISSKEVNRAPKYTRAN